MAPELVGADPLAQRVVQTRLAHRRIKLGPDRALAPALVAVDMALRDPTGRILDQPLHRLLGGAWRLDLPCYASVGGNARRTPDEVCRVVEARLALGPSLVKVRLDADRHLRDADIPGDIAGIRAARRLLGDGFPLAFDANNAYSVQGAIRVGRVLQELGCAWFEEPVQHYHLGAPAQRLRPWRGGGGAA